MEPLRAIAKEVAENLPIHLLAVGVLVLLAHGAASVIHAFVSFVKLRGSFTLSGVWVGLCRLPNYPPGVEAVEIYRVVARGNQIDLSFFNYRPDVREIVKYEGAGVLRGQLLSAYYFVPRSGSSESGVFVLKLFGDNLNGVYAQYDARAGAKLVVSPEDEFALNRIALGAYGRLRLVFGLAPVKSHTEARALYDRVATTQVP